MSHAVICVTPGTSLHAAMVVMLRIPLCHLSSRAQKGVPGRSG
jgi:hypothetical protein